MPDKNFAYSPLKIFHHQKELAALRDKELTSPVHVQLIISDLCNQDCGFCAYRMSGYTSNVLFGEPDSKGRTNPNRMISLDKCVEILEDCKRLGTKAVQFTGGGEPTVHPNHAMIFQECLDRNLELALVTNGVAIKGELLDVLLRASWVRVSIDAGQSKTYSEIRKVDPTVFERVWENLENLVNNRDRHEVAMGVESDLIIGVGFVVTKENWKEVVICTNRAKEIGVDNVRISAVFQSDGMSYFDGWFDEASELCEVAEDLTTPTFKVFNNFNKRVADLHPPDYSFCGLQNFQTYIGADLNLYRCCNLAYNPRGVIGSLKDQTFYDLWREKTFEGFDAKGCPRCMYNDKNKVILYALESDPVHGGFV